MNHQEFIELLWQKGRELYRDMPWRDDTRPYFVLLSELMLQQTQVDRVVLKFNAFIQRFPDVHALAAADLADVLTLWNGLGYNRRARYVHDSAKQIVTRHNGSMPRTYNDLIALPGVGPGTAGAIMTYAFNTAQPFVETNVRTVYFHHFFSGMDQVSDVQVLEKVVATIDHVHPREFYWALMDYGAWLKRQGAGRNDQSSSYKKQSPLKGSVREVRGQIIRTLTTDALTDEALRLAVTADARFDTALRGLLRDGLIMMAHGRWHLTK